MYNNIVKYVMSNADVHSFEVGVSEKRFTSEQKEQLCKALFNADYNSNETNNGIIALNTQHIVSIEFIQSEVQEDEENTNII